MLGELHDSDHVVTTRHLWKCTCPRGPLNLASETKEAFSEAGDHLWISERGHLGGSNVG